MQEAAGDEQGETSFSDLKKEVADRSHSESKMPMEMVYDARCFKAGSMLSKLTADCDLCELRYFIERSLNLPGIKD